MIRINQEVVINQARNLKPRCDGRQRPKSIDSNQSAPSTAPTIASVLYRSS
ncbi:hypothetical protein PGT21_007735 [Puccinia graminis f. sp. tritici]|uniref:Uncharacterized protein n=1 Tax=Puccinia graminis f. sp. tritici TaxID=56615 RepID=A0A5B0P7F0_PUCGR|nr:hypothetical protein PGT21_007735 [Puccinia graminis f. sp. tritici]